MLPSISVITPSYNQAVYIQQTIESVLNQAYPRLEYIVVDGLSTDHSLDVIQRYTPGLHLIAERDEGQTDAINKGLRRATGDIVCWINADDFLVPDALKTVGTFFATHPDRLWLTGDCLIVDSTNRRIQEPIRIYKKLLRHLPPTAYLGLTNALCQPSTFWRRSVHEQLGYLNPGLHYTMDYEWWLRLSQLQPPAIVNQPLAGFRIHQQSKGGSRFVQQFEEDYQTLCRYSTSPLVRSLHWAHNGLITTAYHVLK